MDGQIEKLIKKVKKKGPHESRVLLKSYCDEYIKAKETFNLNDKAKCKRIQEKWNDLFWKKLEERLPEKLESKDIKKKSDRAENANLPGMDEDW
jgi:hypothetical protein